MTLKEVKTYLMQIRNKQKLIQAKKNKIQQLRTQAESITATISQDVVQTSSSNKSFADAISAAMDLEQQIYADMLAEITVTETIIKQLNAMSQEHAQLASVLYLYYVNSLTWEQVCVELELSWVHVVGRLHSQALTVFKNFMPML